MSWLYVALGGAAGSLARHGVGLVLAGFGGFPWATLLVNWLGSALIGLAHGLGLGGEARLLLVTGFLGGFTTFSAFSLDAAMLAERSPALAALYVGASVAGGLLLFWLASGWVRLGAGGGGGAGRRGMGALKCFGVGILYTCRWLFSQVTSRTLLMLVFRLWHSFCIGNLGGNTPRRGKMEKYP